MLPDPEALARFAASTMAEEIRGAIQSRGEAVVALPGGSTPKPVFALLAAEERVEWAKVVLVPADERVVPVTDPQSNEGMIRANLVDRIQGTAPMLVGWEVEEGLGPELLRGRFEGRLLGLVPRLDGQLHFDLVVLGMGDDGHTASLFPGRAYSEQELALATHNPLGQARLSLGPAVLRSALRTRLLLEGSAKAAVLAEVVRGPYDPVRWPAQLVARRSPHCQVWCDAAAAAALPHEGAHG